MATAVPPVFAFDHLVDLHKTGEVEVNGEKFSLLTIDRKGVSTIFIVRSSVDSTRTFAVEALVEAPQPVAEGFVNTETFEAVLPRKK